MKIFITGCARSGTTLLRRLFYSFDEVEVIDLEISLDDFIDYQSNSPALVGKRTKKSIFSHNLPRRIEERYISSITNYNIKIINMVRDGRDVIESGENAWPKRWIDSMKAAKRHHDIIDMTIPYERLVSRPDVVQREIAETYGLVRTSLFSDYPSFVPDRAFEEHLRYDPRPIDNSRVKKNYDWRTVVPKDLEKEFETMCEQYAVSFAKN